MKKTNKEIEQITFKLLKNLSKDKKYKELSQEQNEMLWDGGW